MSLTGKPPGSGYIAEIDGMWVHLTSDSIRTIGSANAGAHLSQDWLKTLFLHVWDNFSNTQCPIYTSSGATSARGNTGLEDWAANKRLSLPDYRGRVIGATGSGASLTFRQRGDTVGAETHKLIAAEMPKHRHRLNVSGTVGMNYRTVSVQTGSMTDQYFDSSGGASYVEDSGSDQFHNNMQPTTFENYYISAGVRL